MAASWVHRKNIKTLLKCTELIPPPSTLRALLALHTMNAKLMIMTVIILYFSDDSISTDGPDTPRVIIMGLAGILYIALGYTNVIFS